MTTRPTAALIDTAALKHNYGELKRLTSPETEVMAIVKANAYGHGDAIVARTLEAAGCRFFGVAFAEEGIRLRTAGIKGHVVLLGGLYGDAEAAIEHGLTPVIFDIEAANLFNEAAKKRGVKRPVHVKIDTGMGRLGVGPENAAAFLTKLILLGNIEVEGLLSHFAEAEAASKDFSTGQLELFKKAVSAARSAGLTPAFTHMANGAAIVDIPESRFNMVRPGLMLYGAYPSASLKDKIRLRPVMTLKTRISHIKDLPEGGSVSYSRTFTAKRKSRIAVLPAGYGDGLPWRLAGSGEVLIRGRRAPIAGRVCMDFTMIDVTDIKDAAPGDEAVIIGEQGGERILAEDLAQRAGTIPYEIFCNVSRRVPRVEA